jgi:hypothetical protein
MKLYFISTTMTFGPLLGTELAQALSTTMCPESLPSIIRGPCTSKPSDPPRHYPVVYLSLEEEEATDTHPMASVNMRIPYA